MGKRIGSNGRAGFTGGIGGGDGASTKLAGDMEPGGPTNGGFKGTASAKLSSFLATMKVVFSEDDYEIPTRFPENEGEPAYRSDNIMENKDTMKLSDLFEDDFFDEAENEEGYRTREPNTTDSIFAQLTDSGIEHPEDLGLRPDHEGIVKLNNIRKPKTLSEKIERMVFESIEKDLEESGLKLVKKGEEDVDEVNAIGSGNIAGHTGPLSRPKNLKQFYKDMLPTGYKYKNKNKSRKSRKK